MNPIAPPENHGNNVSPKALAMKEAIREAAGDDHRTFSSFDAFYNWWDTLTGYEQMDADADLCDDRTNLVMVYDLLLAEGFFTEHATCCGPQQSTEFGYGVNAFRELGVHLPLQALQSAAGFYIGTQDHEGPASRESVEYFKSQEEAQQALVNGAWSQRP